jgi:phosphatidylglycerol:prolipoprotein diacylglycerol transferase
MFPRLIQIGDFYLPTYGVLLALAFLSALWLAGRLGRRVGLEADRVTDVGLVAALAGIAGAKITMYLFDWDYFSQHPGEAFSLTTLQAAGVFQGGLILALVAAVWYIRRKRMPLLTTFDVFAPGLALGHAIGRLGCFAAGCCWGAECRLPWAVTFRDPFANERFGTPLNVPLHPSQLYEAGAELAIFAFLMWLFNKRTHREGALLGWYLVLYSIVRFLVEFVRYHDQPLQAGLSLTQWMSLALLPVGVWLLVKARETADPAGKAGLKSRAG